MCQASFAGFVPLLGWCRQVSELVSGWVSRTRGAILEKKLKYLSFDRRTDTWRYRRQFKDRTWFTHGFRTDNRKVAEQEWPRTNARFERKARQKAMLGSKELRRAKFWEAAARFLIAEQRGHGRLLRPPNVEPPTRLGITSHPFVFVRNLFKAWAQTNDPDVILVLEAGDANPNEKELFHAGIVAAYFTVSEMERLADSELKPAPLRLIQGRLASKRD
jgi:hypothetical protein